MHNAPIPVEDDPERNLCPQHWEAVPGNVVVQNLENQFWPQG
jgi:hypothetical protein